MTAACPQFAVLLRQAGERDLAWDYQTTPLAVATTESNQWYQLAAQLGQQDETEQADRAFATAFALDPTNAQILWDRAMNLTRKGMTPKARELYGEIAEGPWPPQYQQLQNQARGLLAK
jgi:tetratricopeptide (TPR) repeat protein